MNRHSLNIFASNIYSQFGEDGIIEEILNRINAASEIDKWCVEFGAWDGVYLSNTCNLIRNKNYKGVLIEGDRIRFQELCKNLPQENIHKICKFVTFEGSSTLDNILKETPIPYDFDFLSIDIDGCDYYIFDSLERYKPKVICIEYNPTIPNEVEFIQPKNFHIKQGASAKSLVNLAISKGYTLVAVTVCNVIFVRNDVSLLVIGSNTYSLENLRDDLEFKTFVFFGYDGTLLSNKDKISIHWHGKSIPIDSFQPLPRLLRTFPADYNFFQKKLLPVYMALRYPIFFFKRKIKKLFK